MLKTLEKPAAELSKAEKVEKARKAAALVYGEALRSAFGEDAQEGIRKMREEGYGHESPASKCNSSAIRNPNLSQF